MRKFKLNDRVLINKEYLGFASDISGTVIGLFVSAIPVCLIQTDEENKKLHPFNIVNIPPGAEVISTLPRIGIKRNIFGWIPETHLKIIQKKQDTIYCCISCKEENKWAEPNQPDGSFKCYKCRNNL